MLKGKLNSQLRSFKFRNLFGHFGGNIIQTLKTVAILAHAVSNIILPYKTSIAIENTVQVCLLESTNTDESCIQVLLRTSHI